MAIVTMTANATIKAFMYPPRKSFSSTKEKRIQYFVPYAIDSALSGTGNGCDAATFFSVSPEGRICTKPLIR
jgi:hypothetical protein